MAPKDTNEQRRHGDRAARLGPPGYFAAALLSGPIGAIAWFELGYLWFGVTGEDLPTPVSSAVAVLVFAIAFGWPLFGARRAAEVVRRGCQLGLLVALLLPVVTMAVLLLWQSAPGQAELGMGGLMLYSLPVIALGVAAVLGIVFGLGGRTAGRRLRQPSGSK